MPEDAALSILKDYQQRLAIGRIVSDGEQRTLVDRLDRLSAELSRSSGFSRRWSLFAGRRRPAPRGLYVYGPVGCGKTMLMDLFYDNLRLRRKQRAHFHEFMADVHERLNVARKQSSGDPIQRVGADIARHTAVLCFDELHVTNIADAMILGRLFARLFADGVTIVATSNSAPTELYKNGLNRTLFLPFIDLLGQQMEVVELRGTKDYRLQKLSGRKLYFTPSGPAATAELDRAFTALTGLKQGRPRTLEVKGRKLNIREAAMGVARFTFEELCDQPLASLDYLRLAHTYHTIVLENVPCLTPDRRNAARRFINLIDTLYDCGTCLIASAEAEPDALYPVGDSAVLFERTASRLYEMRTEGYLKERRRIPLESQGAGPADAGLPAG